MTIQINKVVRNQTPTLLDADKANELISAINAMQRSTGLNGIKVDVEGDGRLVVLLESSDVDLSNLSEEQVFICRNGEPVAGLILFKELDVSDV